MSGSVSIRSILEGNNTFNGTNFLDWEMNLRIVLTHEKILYTIEGPLPPEPPLEEIVAHEAWKTHKGDMITAQCIILAAMTPEHRRQHKGYDAYEIMERLKDLYKERTRHERYDVARKLFRCRMTEGSSVEKHVTEMIGYIDRLSELNMGMDAELSLDLVLQSLPDCYGQFIMNFNMMNMDKTLGELLSMLREAEPEINKKAKGNVLLIGGGKGRKAKPKSKKAKKKKGSSTAPSGGVQKTKARKGKEDAICFHCNKPGHWKRNCKEYLTEVQKKKGSTSGTSGIYVIEVNLSTSVQSTWVLDTGSGAHICTSVQGLRETRRDD